MLYTYRLNTMLFRYIEILYLLNKILFHYFDTTKQLVEHFALRLGLFRQLEHMKYAAFIVHNPQNLILYKQATRHDTSLKDQC